MKRKNHLIAGLGFILLLLLSSLSAAQEPENVNQLILEGYLGECAWDAMTSKDVAKRKEAIMELVKVYSKK